MLVPCAAIREHTFCVAGWLAAGTVLMHLSFAVKQDQALGKCVLDLVKNRRVAVSPFCLAALLTVARVQRFEASRADACLPASQLACVCVCVCWI